MLQWLGKKVRSTTIATAVSPERPGVSTINWENLQWVNIERPTRAEMSFLRREFGFHPLALDDCLSRIQLPKIDEYDDHIFLVLHFPLFNPALRLTQPSQVAIFAAGGYVVTIHRGELRPLTKLFADCMQSETVRREVMGRSSGYLLYRILDVLVDDSFPILNKVIDNLDRVEEAFSARDPGRIIRDLSILRRDIVAFRRIIRPQVEVMEILERKEYPLLRVDPDVYFGDLADHTRRIWEELEWLKEASDGLSDTVFILHGVISNDALRVLTVLFTLTLPAVSIGTIYGMNVPLPLQGHWWFVLVMLAISAIPAAGMLYWFRRKGWL